MNVETGRGRASATPDNEKTLTVIVPAYNSEGTLRACLDSFLNFSVLDEIEVLVVNDGSTDGTGGIAREYCEKYPGFCLIGKENGGHGSVINAASRLAKGKYFKVVDSDDRLLTQNLGFFIDSLKKTGADVVLTHFHTLDGRNGRIREYKMGGVTFGREHTFDEFWKHKKQVFPVLQLHGITYRSDFYRAGNINLSEKISYEDQEYSTLPFAALPTVMPLDVFLEEYNIGDPNQSMSPESLDRNLSHLEAVLFKIEGASAGLGGAAADYFSHKLREVMLICFMSAMLKIPDAKKGRRWARGLRRRVRARNAALYKATGKQYLTCLALSLLGVNGGVMAKLQKFRIYRAIARLLHH